MQPVGDAEAVPGPATSSDWPTFGPVEKDTVYLLPNRQAGDPAAPDAAAVPQPRQPRDVGRAARPLALQQAEEAGVYILRRDRPAPSCSSRTAQVRRRALGRQGARPRRRAAVELRARLGPDRQGHRARRGHGRPSDRRGDPPLRPRLRGPAAVGARREGGLGGPEAARPGRSTRWAGRCSSRAKYREFGGSFIYPMGEDKVSIGFVVGLDYRDATLLRARRAPGAEDAPDGARSILEGGKRVGWGAKTIPSGGYWAHARRQLWAPGHGASPATAPAW